MSELEPLSGGDVEVDLDPSSAKHFLRASNPSFGQFMQLLRSSQAAGTPVLLTENPDSHNIIDVRAVPAGEQEQSPPQPAAPPVPPAMVEELVLDLSAITPHRADQNFDLAAAPAIVAASLLDRPPVTHQRAHELFHQAYAWRCAPDAIRAPCIPFLYPDDGCWARAQAMCNMFLEGEVKPGKIWNYGDLAVKTRNSPQCEVSWVYHVAAILHVKNGGAVEVRVLDPSLFRMPVPLSEWIHKQGDLTATQVASDPSVFYRSPKDRLEFDPTGDKTVKELTLCRLRLRLRCARVGPPPYANCP